MEITEKDEFSQTWGGQIRNPQLLSFQMRYGMSFEHSDPFQRPVPPLVPPPMLGEYSKFSGLKPNIRKCECMWLGPPKSRFCDDLSLSWVTELKVLGVVFSANPDQIEDLNFPGKLSSMKNCWIFGESEGCQF